MLAVAQLESTCSVPTAAAAATPPHSCGWRQECFGRQCIVIINTKYALQLSYPFVVCHSLHGYVVGVVECEEEPGDNVRVVRKTIACGIV